jgi:hypothetical protein
MREATARELVLTAAIPEMLDEVFTAVRTLLESAPGSIPVSVAIRRPGHYEAKVKLPSHLAVRPSPQLTEGLSKLLGPSAVKYL